MRPKEARRAARNEARAHPDYAWPRGRYRVIYADPPWSYSNELPASVPADHYPTLTTVEIAALPVRDLALDDAVLFLWATWPVLPEALAVVEAWGFAYKTLFVWDKVLHNVGHYSSVRSEPLVLATRGSCQPDVRRLLDNVHTEERTVHSRKPEWFRELIHTIYPVGPRIELFARTRVAGWAAHGYEVPGS
jgi:N6-adenosine-specific RNA methylase IME4